MRGRPNPTGSAVVVPAKSTLARPLLYLRPTPQRGTNGGSQAMKHRHRVIVLYLFTGLASGCASAGAQVVRGPHVDGEIETWGPVGSSASRARALLLEQCPRGYTVDSLGVDLGLGRSGADLVPAQESPRSTDRHIVRFRCHAPREAAPPPTLASR